MTDTSDEAWEGRFDTRGRPHGRGTLRFGKRSRYEGRMHHGQREGMGTLYVDEASDEDEDEDEVSRLRVAWLHDAPHGRGVFTEPGGAELHGVWVDGALEGAAHEVHASGALRYVGEYSGGLRHGHGVELREDGGVLAGRWAEGALHGPRCCYLYPCVRGGALVGAWEGGRMRRASYRVLTAPVNGVEEQDDVATATDGTPEGGGLPAPLPAAVVHPWAAALVRAAAAGAGDEWLPRRDPREAAVAHEEAGPQDRPPRQRPAVLSGSSRPPCLRTAPHEPAGCVARPHAAPTPSRAPPQRPGSVRRLHHQAG